MKMNMKKLSMLGLFLAGMVSSAHPVKSSEYVTPAKKECSGRITQMQSLISKDATSTDDYAFFLKHFVTVLTLSTYYLRHDESAFESFKNNALKLFMASAGILEDEVYKQQVKEAFIGINDGNLYTLLPTLLESDEPHSRSIIVHTLWLIEQYLGVPQEFEDIHKQLYTQATTT